MHLAGDLEIPGVDFGVIADGAFGVAALSLGGSLIGWLKELGLVKGAPPALDGS